MNIEVFDLRATCRSQGAAKVGISIQPIDAGGKRLGVFRLRENAVTDYFWNGGGSDSYNRFAGGHRFQKNNAEAFLQTGQTKYVRTIIFLRQLGLGYIAEPMHNSV